MPPLMSATLMKLPAVTAMLLSVSVPAVGRLVISTAVSVEPPASLKPKSPVLKV